MSDVIKRIDTMIDGFAARLGISVTDMADLLSDAKDEILELQRGPCTPPTAGISQNMRDGLIADQDGMGNGEPA